MSQVSESQPDKRSYLLEAWLNDSESSRETREMKGRDSPFGDITPPCSACASFIRPMSLQPLPPSSFLRQQKSGRSFRAGKSSGGCSSGLEQGAADATPEPPALGKKREGTGARSMMTEGWRAMQDWRAIWECSIKTRC